LVYNWPRHDPVSEKRSYFGVTVTSQRGVTVEEEEEVEEEEIFSAYRT
jgi:hypothetical protein